MNDNRETLYLRICRCDCLRVCVREGPAWVWGSRHGQRVSAMYEGMGARVRRIHHAEKKKKKCRQ